MSSRIPVSVSAPHSIANIRKTHPEIIAEVRRYRRAAQRALPATSTVETSALDRVRLHHRRASCRKTRCCAWRRRCVEAGADDIGLADTVGYANPAQVKRLFTRLRAEVGDKTGGAHLHNTRGQGLANVVAALDAGVTTFDSSQGGIGGCPYAPGATGNIVTEDLVFLLEVDGRSTPASISTS